MLLLVITNIVKNERFIYKYALLILIRNVIVKMEQKITFNINTEDKKLLQKKAEKKGLSISSFCRFYLLKEIFKKEGDSQ